MTDKQHRATVIGQREVAPRHYRLSLRAPEVARAVVAGQFVHLLPRGDGTLDPLLRRAFSILTADGDEIELLYRIEGKGTALMAKLAGGDTVQLLGPLGNGFAPPEPGRRCVLVGGGVGVPPLAMLASTLGENLGAPAAGAPVNAMALLGARGRAELICLEDFARCRVPTQIATDDGSAGHHGRVTELLQRLFNAPGAGPADTVVYSCGPLPMLRAVAAICHHHGARCQVSLEENMPCGIGVCNGCVVPVNIDGDEYSRYRRICVEGPVLWGDEVHWDGLARVGR